MEKNTKTTTGDISSSVASLYAELLSRRRQEDEAREERKAQKRAEKEEAKKEKEDEKVEKLSKKERRERELDSWKEVIVGLTGDDLEYSSQKKAKKKYRKWIDDDDNTVTPIKPKKHKKANYKKEFDAELNMLKTLVADQNKFTADLQRRFQNAAGPANKDAMPLNKTMVELASAINASRGNSLGVLREIGNIKKTIADLYMKQKKMDSEGGNGSNMETTDLGLMGSNLAAAWLNETPSYTPGPMSTPTQANPVQEYSQPQPVGQVPMSFPTNPVPASSAPQPFDPSQWEGPDLGNNSTYYETIPHSTVVEWDKANNTARFKAISNETGEELVGCPVPTSDPMKLQFNEKDRVVKGTFDEVYKLDIIGE